MTLFESQPNEQPLVEIIKSFTSLRRPPSQVRWSELRDAYFAEVRRSRDTCKRQKSYAAFIEAHFGDPLVSELPHLFEALKQQERFKRKGRKYPWAGVEANANIAIFGRSVVNHGWKSGRLDRRVKIPVPKKPKPDRDQLTALEFALVDRCAAAGHLRTAIRLMYFCGMTHSQAKKLTRAHVNLTAGKLKPQTSDRRIGGISRKAIPLIDPLASLFRRQLPSTDTMPLINYHGRPVWSLKKAFSNACDRAIALVRQDSRLRDALPDPERTIRRLQKWTLAKVRNAGGRELADCGVPLEIIAAFLDQRVEVVEKKFPRSMKAARVTPLDVLDQWDPTKLKGDCHD